MSSPDRPSDPDSPAALTELLAETFAACACAIYPTAPAVQMLDDLRERQAERDLARDRRKTSGALRRPNRPRDQRSFSMHERVQEILRHPSAGVTARILLTLPFWSSGIAKLADFNGGVAEMAHHGLEPGAAFNIATIATQLIGSALIIADRRAWLGAGALGAFTALTILLVHHFWNMAEGTSRMIAFHTAVEHVGIIGGLLAIAVLSAQCAPRPANDRAPRNRSQQTSSR